MGTTPRTGNQYSIHHGDFSAVVCELGSKLRRFDYGGKEVFCSYGPDDLTPTCCGYILAPWPNRIKDGEYDFNCKHYCAPVNEYHPEPRNNANHGYAYQYMWKLESLTENSVTQSLRFPNLDGYPFDVTVTATYELNDKGMTVTVSARNDGDEPAPWALGLHPWVANGKNGETSEQRDADSAACRLKIDADTHVTVDAGLVPNGTEPVDGTKFDLRDDPVLDGRAFDDAWVDVHRADDGTTTTVFTRPDGMEIKLVGDETSEQRDADSAACRLKIDADTHVTVDAGLVPNGTEPVDGTKFDLRDDPVLDGRAFDDAWVDVHRADDGTTTTVFTRPDGMEIKLVGDETINAWQCYTATGAPFDQHPNGIAVEPMTAPANAFRSGDHLTVIEPGKSVTTVVRYEVTVK